MPRLKGCQKHSVEVAQLDLASLSSVKSFAADFNARGLPLDVLVCNAGIMAPPVRGETEDGLEQQFQVSTEGRFRIYIQHHCAHARVHAAAPKVQLFSNA